MPRRSSKAVDPIRAEVVARFLLATAEEMNATLTRTAFSPNIKERADCSTAIFDAAQQQSSPVLQQGGPGVEHAVDGIRPMLAGQDGVVWVSKQQRRIVIAFDVDQSRFRSGHDETSSSSDFCKERISSNAIRKDSVDSAP